MCLYNFTLDADVFQLNVDASGVVPQISVIMVSSLYILTIYALRRNLQGSFLFGTMRRDHALEGLSIRQL